MSVAERLLERHHRFHECGYIYTKEGFTMPGQTPQKEVVIKPPTEVAKEVATQPAPLLHKPEQDQDTIASQVSTNVDGQVQLRMVYDNILLSPLTLLDVQQDSKSIEVAKDMRSWFKKPVDTAHGVSSNVPDLVQKKVAIQPLQGEENIPTEVAKEVAIQPAPLLQKTVQRPIQQVPATQKEVAI